jgi:hypothetical protein
MTTQLTVFASAEADAAGRIAETVASLPISLHPGGEGADLVGVVGDAGWTEAAARAIRAGARGVLVVDPVAEDATALSAEAEAAAVPVVLDSPWAHNPAVLEAAAVLADRNDRDTLLEVRVDLPVGADLDRVLLGQLALVRAVAGPVSRLRFDRRNRTGYDALGLLASGARLNLSAILSDGLQPGASVRVIRAEDAVRLSVPHPGTAAPGRLVVSDERGATLRATTWESAHRVAWRRLHQLVTAEAPWTELDGFEQDVAVAAEALEHDGAAVR